MTRPADIPEDVYERAAILCDRYRDEQDDIVFVSRILMEVDPLRARRMGLTTRQAEVLDYIEKYQVEHPNSSPAYSQIAKDLGLVSKGNVHRLVHALADRGAISLGASRAQSISIVGRA
ncbi:MAG: hypothetical protein P0Y65_05645 [Candidatus Devosia phytovorans]|uniref:LexA repressor DNA-binding domain-containing protein n=1 Tax=Candidatus Devosia phytovorans TaxID=3121372 RepID=A0AAJ6B2R3_9HYPH|nr:hypothetical protein [Devosia sp.]WEK05738.1 MAG: hypothetical protein P0Y65_05645 [Devosia sp.]